MRDEKFSNGVCDATPEYNNKQCKFDNGECINHNKNYSPANVMLKMYQNLAMAFVMVDHIYILSV